MEKEFDVPAVLAQWGIMWTSASMFRIAQDSAAKIGDLSGYSANRLSYRLLTAHMVDNVFTCGEQRSRPRCLPRAGLAATSSGNLEDNGQHEINVLSSAGETYMVVNCCGAQEGHPPQPHHQTHVSQIALQNILQRPYVEIYVGIWNPYLVPDLALWGQWGRN